MSLNKGKSQLPFFPLRQVTNRERKNTVTTFWWNERSSSCFRHFSGEKIFPLTSFNQQDCRVSNGSLKTPSIYVQRVVVVTVTRCSRCVQGHRLIFHTLGPWRRQHHGRLKIMDFFLLLFFVLLLLYNEVGNINESSVPNSFFLQHHEMLWIVLDE